MMHFACEQHPQFGAWEQVFSGGGGRIDYIADARIVSSP